MSLSARSLAALVPDIQTFATESPAGEPAVSSPYQAAVYDPTAAVYLACIPASLGSLDAQAYGNSNPRIQRSRFNLRAPSRNQNNAHAQKHDKQTNKHIHTPTESLVHNYETRAKPLGIYKHIYIVHVHAVVLPDLKFGGNAPPKMPHPLHYTACTCAPGVVEIDRYSASGKHHRLLAHCSYRAVYTCTCSKGQYDFHCR